MNFKIAVCSYMRKNALFKKTYKLLKSLNVPTENVYIFVANTEEEEEYRTMGFDCNIVVAFRGLVNARNFAIDYFEDDQNILFLDDDITSIKVLDEQYNKETKTSKSHKMESTEFIESINSYFEDLRSKNLFMFGFYPAGNSLFMKMERTYDLRFLVGNCYGVINRRNVKNCTVLGDSKEDYLRTLQYFRKDGGVMRINSVFFQTTVYKGVGGMQNPDRLLNEQIACDYLLKTHFKVFAIKKCKSIYPEVRFIRGAT